MLRFILGFEAKRNTNHKSFIINNLRCYVSSFRTIFCIKSPLFSSNLNFFNKLHFPSKKLLTSLAFAPRRLICPPNHPCSTHSLPLRPRCPLSPCECGASHRRLQRRPRRPATPGAPSTHPLERLHHLQGNFKPVKEGQCFQATMPLKRTEYRLQRILTLPPHFPLPTRPERPQRPLRLFTRHPPNLRQNRNLTQQPLRGHTPKPQSL